jgi:hypothetical protein
LLDAIRRHTKLAALIALGVLVVGGGWGWEFSASLRGRAAAHFDVARGRYQILGYGLPAAWQPEYAWLLRQRYGIEYRAVAGCIVSRSLVDYVDGYDSVSAAAAKRRFGRDVFRECSADASMHWEHRAAANAHKE